MKTICILVATQDEWAKTMRTVLLLAKRLRGHVKQVTWSTIVPSAEQHETGVSLFPVELTLFQEQTPLKIICVRTDMGSLGSDSSALVTADIIYQLKGRHVLYILAGICFGAKPESQTVGDVIVAEEVHLYDRRRMQSGTTIPLTGSTLKATAQEFLQYLKASLELHEHRTTAKFGMLLSGDKLVADKEFRDLIKLNNRALGGDMEAAGFYSALNRYRQLGITIKSICDFADELKNDQYHQKALNSTALFVLRSLRAWIKHGTVFPSDLH